MGFSFKAYNDKEELINTAISSYFKNNEALLNNALIVVGFKYPTQNKSTQKCVLQIQVFSHF